MTASQDAVTSTDEDGSTSPDFQDYDKKHDKSQNNFDGEDGVDDEDEEDMDELDEEDNDLEDDADALLRFRYINKPTNFLYFFPVFLRGMPI